MEIDSLEIGKMMWCTEVASGITLKIRQKDKANGKMERDQTG